MYHAKDKGRSKFEFFNTALERLAQYQIALENKLRSAMHNQEMTVYFQPQVNSHGFQIERMEALLRWFPPSGNTISPVDFVPVAERAGLIGELGLWFFEQMCIAINKWKALGLDQLNVSVNLSGRQISDSKLVEQIKEIMLRHHIDGKLLEFEITESILMEDLEKVTLVLNQLRELNISIAIDDFGTGYSSLRYLQKLPIDILKIDRSFITDLSDDIGRQSIVNSIIYLGHNLSLKTVAEGVEDKSVVEYLANKNCEYIQGFYFYKPMDAETFADLLLKQRDK